MKFTAIIVTLYGIVVALGGLIGYLTADSLASLVAGSICGALLFASGLGLMRYSVLAFVTAIIVTLGLACFFGFRVYYFNLKFMPAGMMTILSSIVFFLLVSTKSRPTTNNEK